jgi:hypothetical protein
MSTSVKTPYFGNFLTPHACVACGAPPSYGETFKCKGSKSNWSGKQTTTLSVDFPLCHECYEVSQNKPGAGWATALGVLVTIGVCITSIMFSADNESPIFFFVGLLLLGGSIALTVNWVKSINQKGFTQEQIERRKRVKRCAYIGSFNTPNAFNKMGSIVFIFTDSAYADQFALMNQGQVVRRTN